jgi:hypothetical protein
LEDNIKKDLKEVGFEDLGWIHLTENRPQQRVLVNTIIGKPLGTIESE